MMQQREVTDRQNTTWTCVQAYTGGLASQATEQATQRAETDDGTVTVVCTPSGGAQTVRLELQSNWLENLSDEELTTAIQAGQ
jgi:hypothetical protein